MNTRTWGPATVLIVAAALIIVAIGGIVVITNPASLSFAQYLNDLSKFVVGVGALAVGRGIHLAGRKP